MTTATSKTAAQRPATRARLAPLLLAALLILVLAPTARAGCCDVCLAQTDPAHDVITYDPLVHDQCSPVKGICCYGCGFSHGSVTFQDGVTFDATSGSPVAKAGTRIRFSYNGVARVTYDLVRVNQKRTSFVGNRSTEADKSVNGEFSICVTAAGTIAMRGWGTNSCTQVTPESTIKVEAVDGATCVAAGTVKPADTSGSATKSNQPVNSLGNTSTTATTAPLSGKFDIANCNLNRGSVVKSADGTQTCECAGDWREPPACDQYSWTKTILTIAGAIATLLSIAISVRAYVKSRKSKAAADGDELDLDDRVSEEVLRIDRRSPSKVPTPSSTRAPTTTAASTAARSPATGRPLGAAATTTRSPSGMPRVKTVRETTL